MHQPVDRRDFVALLGSGLLLSFGAPRDAEAMAIGTDVRRVAPAPLEFFTPDEARDFDAFAAQIIPSDELPGAREARVTQYVDHIARLLTDTGEDVRENLKTLGDAVAQRTGGSRSFAALTESEQVAVMMAMEKSTDRSHARAFARLRNIAVEGLVCDPMHGGNYRKVGWKLIGFDDRYSWKPPFGAYDHA